MRLTKVDSGEFLCILQFAAISRSLVHVYYTLSTLLQQAELHEIVEITAPDSMTLTDRRDARRVAEDYKFDEEYYL